MVEMLGIPREMSRAEAQDLSDRLEDLWDSVVGDLGDLEGDLIELKIYFDPVATSKRLRSALLEVPSSNARLVELGDPLVLQVAPGKVLPTPEGRVALALLRDQLVTGSPVVKISDSALVEAQNVLITLYRDWSRHRLNQTIAFAAGDAPPLRLPSVGIIVFLLVDRLTDKSRALPGSDEHSKSRTIERIVIEAAGEFAMKLGAKNLDTSKETLYRGWWLGEVARHADPALVRGKSIYIDPGHENEMLALAATQLSRRSVDKQAVGSAFDSLVSYLRTNRDQLAGFGLDFERPPDTERLRSQLLDFLSAASTG